MASPTDVGSATDSGGGGSPPTGEGSREPAREDPDPDLDPDPDPDPDLNPDHMF